MLHELLLHDSIDGALGRRLKHLWKYSRKECIWLTSSWSLLFISKRSVMTQKEAGYSFRGLCLLASMFPCFRHSSVSCFVVVCYPTWYHIVTEAVPSNRIWKNYSTYVSSRAKQITWGALLNHDSHNQSWGSWWPKKCLSMNFRTGVADTTMRVQRS